MDNKVFWNFLRSGLRRLWLRYPDRSKALLASRRKYSGDNKRQQWEYQCRQCEQWLKGTEVQVDHILPCGTLLTEDDIRTFVLRLFCHVVDLQVLCKPCHNIKTQNERKSK